MQANNTNEIPVLTNLELCLFKIQKELVTIRKELQILRNNRRNEKNEEYYHNVVSNLLGSNTSKIYEIVHNNKKHMLFRWSNYELAFEQIKTQSYNTSVIFFGDGCKKQQAIEKLKSENIDIYEIEEVDDNTKINVIYEHQIETSPKIKFMNWLENHLVISTDNSIRKVLNISSILKEYTNNREISMGKKSMGVFTGWVEEFLLAKNYHEYKSKQHWSSSLDSGEDESKNIRG